MDNELINDYIDGTLPIEREEELFAILSNNAEARAELKSLLYMKDAIRTDTKAFTPSVKSTGAIFSQLGFTPPVLPPVQVPSPSIIDKLKDIANINLKTIVTSIISASLTAIVFTVYMTSISEIIAENSTISQYDNYQLNSIESIDNDNPFKEDKADAMPNLDDYDINNACNAFTLIDDSQPMIQIIDEADLASINNYYSNDKFIEPKPENGKLMFISNKTEIFDTNELNRDFLNDIVRNNVFSFEIYGSYYHNNTNEQVNSIYEQTLNNTILNFIYTINNDFSIGLDYRRENFNYRIDENNLSRISDKLIGYGEKPNFETAGLILRYHPEFAKLPYSQLFTQVMIGGNKVGYVGRLMLGAEIEPIANYTILIGYDWSKLVFSSKEQILHTSKNGLHIGAGIKF